MNKTALQIKIMNEINHSDYSEQSPLDIFNLVEATSNEIKNNEYYLEYIQDGKLALDCCENVLCRCYWLKVTKEGDSLYGRTLINVQI